MRFRGKSIRRKIVALMLVPLVSLTALWGFATVLTGQEANHLLKASSVAEEIGEPVADALHDIQEERRATLVYLADRRAAGALPALRESRVATDRAAARITRNAAKPEVRDDLRSDTARRLTSFKEGLDGLIALRRSVESAAVSRGEALEFYNRIVDPGFSFLATLQTLHDEDMERQGRGLIGLARAMEMLSREDALIASALATGKVSDREVRQLSDFVANRKLYYEVNLESMPAKEREVYLRLWRSPQTQPLRDAEERLIEEGSLKDVSEAEAKEWQSAANPVLDELRDSAKASNERYQDRVGPAAYDVFILAGLAGVVGFLALLVSIIVSVRIGRDLIRDLTRLRKEAHEVSGVRLPSVMRRLAAGEPVDVETEAPRLEYEKDEIGQAGQALNTLQRAAVEAAVRQAEMRRGVSEVFVNLARRNQVLLHRQLTLLDAMERRTEDTDELADLFRLDHLTTRMRRHAEGLVILSGAAPSRQWRKPIQLMDVVRAAVAEVEDYERIEVRRLPRIGVGGPAVADLTHLIAELLENATVFSPPHTAVQVHGERVANGFTLEIHDRGLGMAADLLLDANLRLAETPEFELSDTDRLGLFVVSRLAQRQNVRVSLQPSPYGGTTAIVFIPAALLTDAPETRGAGFRLDRKSESQSARRGGENKRTALSALTGPGQDPPVFFGEPVELGGSTNGLGALGAGPAGVGRGQLDAAPSGDPFEGFPGAPDRGDAPGGDNALLRPLARGSWRPTSGEHQQANDPTPERTSGTVPLPRRQPPTLVSDHGRRVDDQGRTHPTAEPVRAEQPQRAYRPEAPMRGAEGTSPARIDGLPRRVRQASLAPQLREGAAAAERNVGRGAGERGREIERDADEVRNRMASMQRGWQRGRLKNAYGAEGAAQTTGTGPGQTAPRTTSEGDGP
ncbi:sensor histidine kinase [Streptomyces sp. NBC_00690]|uniref:sensor histidine kinase n=1 Tax=Streptomyces sp. NBC_00690 TaxID=2975808 RepID=UPI002E2BB5CE|nr:nitrate- and nitrite sensing domain-containing protein [Streptomyces sp. NBC_00690]